MMKSTMSVPCCATSRCRWGTRSILSLLTMAVLATGCEVPTALPRIESSFLFPIEDLVLPVTGVNAAASVSQDLSDIDLTDNVRGAVLRITPINPAAATGTLSFRISGGGVVLIGSVNVAGPADQRIELSEEETRALIGGSVDVSASGTLCQASGCGFQLPPFPEVTLKTDIQLRVEIGGEG